MMLNTAARTAIILLAIGIVVGVTWALTEPLDLKAIEARELAQIQKRPATPGSEAMLRQVIDENQRGQPDYAHMSPALAKNVRAQVARSTQALQELGPVQSVAYLGGQRNADVYRVDFANGFRLWGIGTDKAGVIDTLFFFSPGVPTPQDYLDNYALFPWGERSVRFAEQIVVLLIAAAVSRYALRIRL